MTSSYFNMVIEVKYTRILFSILVSIGNVLLEKSIKVYSKPSALKYD